MRTETTTPTRGIAPEPTGITRKAQARTIKPTKLVIRISFTFSKVAGGSYLAYDYALVGTWDEREQQDASPLESALSLSAKCRTDRERVPRC